VRDTWYADNRDLIKWGVLLRLADIFQADRIVHFAFYRPSEFGRLVIDGHEYDIPQEVIAHFRNLRTIGSLGSKVRITVFDPVFEDRATHQQAVLALLPAFRQERCIVFLDPDTGLEPQSPNLDHVLGSEARAIWDGMQGKDVFAFYQHHTRSGEPWIPPKQAQLAKVLGLPLESVKIANAPQIAQNVVFFYAQKAAPIESQSNRQCGR
jgi:hypothetical protein